MILSSEPQYYWTWRLLADGYTTEECAGHSRDGRGSGLWITPCERWTRDNVIPLERILPEELC